MHGFVHKSDARDGRRNGRLHSARQRSGASGAVVFGRLFRFSCRCSRRGSQCEGRTSLRTHLSLSLSILHSFRMRPHECGMSLVFFSRLRLPSSFPLRFRVYRERVGTHSTIHTQQPKHTYTHSNGSCARAYCGCWPLRRGGRPQTGAGVLVSIFDGVRRVQRTRACTSSPCGTAAAHKDGVLVQRRGWRGR